MLLKNNAYQKILRKVIMSLGKEKILYILKLLEQFSRKRGKPPITILEAIYHEQNVDACAMAIAKKYIYTIRKLSLYEYSIVRTVTTDRCNKRDIVFGLYK